MIDIVIYSEFKALIPPLSDAELEGLESDIVEAGRALVPLMLWNKILVDGHNRYAICTKHDLPYEVMEVGHPEWTRTDARIWIRRNQLHRHNIDSLTRCEIALGLEEDLKEQAMENNRLSAAAAREAKSLTLPMLAKSETLDPVTESLTLPTLAKSETL